MNVQGVSCVQNYTVWKHESMHDILDIGNFEQTKVWTLWLWSAKKFEWKQECQKLMCPSLTKHSYLSAHSSERLLPRQSQLTWVQKLRNVKHSQKLHPTFCYVLDSSKPRIIDQFWKCKTNHALITRRLHPLQPILSQRTFYRIKCNNCYATSSQPSL